ncbi:hypothetical protein AAFF_G00216690 [Aldrovandia affinis]|uniref:Uncharacterized protein n=1 Tax=Aldrovandia affinis TaxID=143900 RepID=A0AAD7RFZ8_9TELE|nr:hypothetical protein AAFF_G00216690 [Aldrovandia affinis]
MSRRREEQGSPLTMEAISDLLDKKLATHSQTITTELHRSFAVIETKLDTLQSTVSTNSLKITELESTINNHDQRLEALESTCSALASKNTQLAAQVLDLQSRSRRNTIRVLGLPEGVEEPNRLPSSVGCWRRCSETCWAVSLRSSEHIAH